MRSSSRSSAGAGGAEPPFEPDEVHPATAVADDRPASDHRSEPGDSVTRDAMGVRSSSPAGDDDDDRAEVDVPLAVASDEERLSGKSFDALSPDELRAALRADVAPAAGHTASAHPPPRARPARPAHRHAPDAAPEPAHRRRSDPARAPAPARRAAPARHALRHLGVDGALRARLPAVPDLRRGHRPERRGVRVRNAAHPPDPCACVAPPRARDPAGGRGGAGLVERHPDRRRAQGVQRPPRAARHGPWRRGRDPLGRLGARRPRARGPRDGAPRHGSPTGSCGSIRA